MWHAMFIEQIPFAEKVLRSELDHAGGGARRGR